MSYYVDHALNLFSIAVQHNFIQGRHLDDVCAACLYIISRIHKTPHMLIDFADTLNVNVYTLGSVYMKLRNILEYISLLFLYFFNSTDCPGLKTVDPSLYIHRFADKLDLGDKKHIVTLTALRLVARMKRDWITRGRRPTGICAAALLIASKMHGFNKGRKDILDVIKVGEKTLKDRMIEFSSTPCGSMTPEEFELLAQQTNDFAVDDVGYSLQDDGLVECNPPSFIKGKIKEKIKEEKLKSENGSNNNPNNSNNNNNVNGNSLVTKDGCVIDLTDITTPGYVVPSNFVEKKRIKSNKVYDEMINEIKEMNTILKEENEIKKDENENDNTLIEKQEQQSTELDSSENNTNTNNNNNNDEITSLSQNEPLITTQPNDNEITTQPTQPTTQQQQQQPQQSLSQSITDDDDSDIEDIDVSSYLLNDNECKEKQMLWERNNKDWEEKQKEKRQLEDDGKLPKKRKKYVYLFLLFIIFFIRILE